MCITLFICCAVVWIDVKIEIENSSMFNKCILLFSFVSYHLNIPRLHFYVKFDTFLTFEMLLYTSMHMYVISK
jgi:hypothetical protein